MKKLINLTRFALADPRAIYYYTQKGIRPYAARKFLSRVIARFRTSSSAAALGERSANWLNLLTEEGYVLIPDILSAEQLTDIHSYLAEQSCVDLTNPELGEFDIRNNLPPETRIARYKPENLLSCPHLLKTANDPDLLAAVGHYIGCEPTMTLLEVWWSLPNAQTQSETANNYQDYQLHRDVEDFKFVKLFIYLSDVDGTSGPHTFVAGSHNDGRLTQRASLDATEVTDNFGLDAQTVFTGSAGLGILEDTFGIHKATPPSGNRRLICSVTYNLTGLNPFSPRRPLGALPPGLNPYVNRLFCHEQPAGAALDA